MGNSYPGLDLFSVVLAWLNIVQIRKKIPRDQIFLGVCLIFSLPLAFIFPFFRRKKKQACDYLFYLNYRGLATCYDEIQISFLHILPLHMYWRNLFFFFCFLKKKKKKKKKKK